MTTMEAKARRWSEWLVARRAERYQGFSPGGGAILNAFRTEQSGSGHVYVVACPECGVPLHQSISSRMPYSPRPGTRAAIGHWSMYEDLPHVRSILTRRSACKPVGIALDDGLPGDTVRFAMFPVHQVINQRQLLSKLIPFGVNKRKGVSRGR